MAGKASCHSAEWPEEVFIQAVLAFVFVCLYWLYPVYANTHTRAQEHTHTYESSFISWLSVLAIFLGGAGLSPSPCSCSLFFAAFCVTQRFIQQSVKSHNYILIIIQLPKAEKITINKWSQIKEINSIFSPFCPTADGGNAGGCWFSPLQ